MFSILLKRKFIVVLLYLFSSGLCNAQLLPQFKDLSLGKPPVLERSRSAEKIFARLLQLEDQRYYSPKEIESFILSSHAGVRRRTVLTLGAIGSCDSLPILISTAMGDKNIGVRAAAAFSLGQVGNLQAVEPLLDLLKKDDSMLVRAYAIEALGKLLGNNANIKKIKSEILDISQTFIIKNLPLAQTKIHPGSDEEFFYLSVITTASKISSQNIIVLLAKLLESPNIQIRRRAAYEIARLQNVQIELISSSIINASEDKDDEVRQIIVRLLGKLRSSEATNKLIFLLKDKQIQVSVVHGMGESNDSRCILPLISLGEDKLKTILKLPENQRFYATELSCLLEIASALGNLKANSAIPFLRELRRFKTHSIGSYVEVETALAKIDSKAFFEFVSNEEPKDWQSVINFILGLGKIGTSESEQFLIDILENKKLPGFIKDLRCIPFVLRALAKHKSSRSVEMLLLYLKSNDEETKATAAELLAEIHQQEDIFNALAKAFEATRNDKTNVAKLSLLTSIAHYDKIETIQIISKSLEDRDYLVRRHAADLLKLLIPNDLEQIAEYEKQVGIVRVDRDIKFYEQLVSRRDMSNPQATVITNKGSVTIELLQLDAPLTVENFIELSKNNFFKKLQFSKIIPNLFVQSGNLHLDNDEKYRVRCEINQHHYERGTVGIANVGKDTGGSQFFICQSSQPNLDGRYALFAKVIEGMDVVNSLTINDYIENIVVSSK